MKELTTKLETLFNSWLNDFEKRPIKTGLKALIILALLKWFYSSFLKEE